MTHVSPKRAAGFVPAVANAALHGLTQPQKTLPPWLFYDDDGCRLFQRITELPEYYLTRTEHALLGASLLRLGEYLSQRLDGRQAALIEFGTSDEAKALHLLGLRMPDQRRIFDAYVAIDVAAPALDAMRARLAQSHPELPVRTVTGDFDRAMTLPSDLPPHLPFGYFAGSTIGNFDPPEARAFLSRAAATLGGDAALLVGFDLRKDPAVLVPAYDDAAGVTAAFNLNLLRRLNREAEANFDIKTFEHRSVWNGARSRIEMHLVSRRAQTAEIAGRTIAFEAGEHIHTENSYKYTKLAFTGLARMSGWQVHAIWTDPQERFALALLDHMTHGHG